MEGRLDIVIAQILRNNGGIAFEAAVSVSGSFAALCDNLLISYDLQAQSESLYLRRRIVKSYKRFFLK